MRTILAAGRAGRSHRLGRVLYILAGFIAGWVAAQLAALTFIRLDGLWLALVPAAMSLVAVLGFIAFGAIVGRVTGRPAVTMHREPPAPEPARTIVTRTVVTRTIVTRASVRPADVLPVRPALPPLPPAPSYRSQR